MNQCCLARGPEYPVFLVRHQFPNGEMGFCLFFSDENVRIFLNKEDAQLVHRFLNNDPDDVLDCFEEDQVQEILEDAEHKVIERQ